MKTFFILLFLTSLTYSQTNWTVKWENPSGTYFKGFGQWERSNSVPEIILRDANYTYKIYDGATKQLKYTYADPDTSAFYNLSMYDNMPWDYTSTPIDVNNDGVNEIIKIKNHGGYSGNSTLTVIDGATGQSLYSSNFPGEIWVNTLDIDGDGYVEILVYNDDLSTDYFLHLWIISTASHVIAVDPNSEPAAKYNLGQNYPNPFNPMTTISYSISKDALVKLMLYNETGQIVGTYINEKQSSGEHKFNFNGTNLASGVYFYQLVVDDQFQAKKMVILK